MGFNGIKEMNTQMPLSYLHMENTRTLFYWETRDRIKTKFLQNPPRPELFFTVIDKAKLNSIFDPLRSTEAS